MDAERHLLAWALGWGQDIRLSVDGRVRREKPDTIPHLVQMLEDGGSHEIMLEPPQYQDVTVLWASVRGTDQVKRARRFPHPPAIVLKLGSGSERLMMWLLDEPFPFVRAQAANEQLCYRFRAPRTRCEPDQLQVPVPGTFLRHGRKRPAPVSVTRCEFETIGAGRLLAGLLVPPPKDAWKSR